MLFSLCSHGWVIDRDETGTNNYNNNSYIALSTRNHHVGYYFDYLLLIIFISFFIIIIRTLTMLLSRYYHGTNPFLNHIYFIYRIDDTDCKDESRIKINKNIFYIFTINPHTIST